MKLKVLKSVAFSLILLFASGITVLAQSKSIFGAYQKCSDGCIAIQIKRNFTFEQRLDGDAINYGQTNGKWRFIGENRIKADSPQPKGELQVQEKIANRKNGYFVVVHDPAGATFPNARISGIASNKRFKCLTNLDGACEIPKCDQFELAFGNNRKTYKIRDARASDFTIYLTIEQLEPVIDVVWQIKGNRLYVVKPDGSVDEENWLEKVTRKKERRLFH